MAITVNLDMMLVRRKVSQVELSERIGITQANLSILKTNKAKAIRFSTLNALCRELNCQPGELLEYVPDSLPNGSTGGGPAAGSQPPASWMRSDFNGGIGEP